MSTYRLEDFGGGVGSEENSTAMIMALDACRSAGGGEILADRGGDYVFKVTGPHPWWSGHQVCVPNADSPHITVRLNHPNARFKLADNQQNNAAGPVDMFVSHSSVADLAFVGPGTIDGNKEGQTGWSSGSAQNIAGNCISTYGTGPRGGRFRIEGLTIRGFHSSPANIGLGTNQMGTDVRLQDVTAYDCGEGWQVLLVDGVMLLDVAQYLTDGSQMAGDMIEVAHCRNAKIIRPVTKAISGVVSGSAIDVGGSQGVYIQDADADGTHDFLGTWTPSFGVPTDDVVVNGAVLRHLKATGCSFQGGSHRWRNVRGYDFDGVPFAVAPPVDQYQEPPGELPPVELFDCLFERCGLVLMVHHRPLKWHHGGNVSSNAAGILIESDISASREIDLAMLDFSGTGPGMKWNGSWNDPGGVQTTAGRVLHCSGTTSKTSKDDHSGLAVI